MPIIEELAEKIHKVIGDYRNDDGINISAKNIIDWAVQFGEDAEFILTEFNHIIPQVYLSKSKAKELIKSHIDKLVVDLKYTSISTFLSDTDFLDVQSDNKSQKAILSLLKEVVTENFELDLTTFVTFPKKNFIYFDDVLATGGTIGKDLIEWLGTKDGDTTNSEHVLNSTKTLSVNLFCQHNWGRSFQSFRLKKTFTDKIDEKIRWYFNYEIQNHIKWNKQNLNNAIPVKSQPANVITYLASLPAEKYEDYAFRKESEPTKEVLFSSAENRIRYENILVQKGLSIIGMINGPISSNIRPLGLINPNYKTLGLGTHFFTWRNIPNNSPLVFWWEVPNHTWLPLFQVANRGN